MLLNKMEDYGCSPDDLTFNTFIRGFLHCNNTTKALDVVSVLTRNCFAADDHTYSLFLDLLSSPNISSAEEGFSSRVFCEVSTIHEVPEKFPVPPVLAAH